MSISIPTLEQLKLNRYPKSHDKSLRAWSAADELLLAEFETLYLSQSSAKPNLKSEPQTNPQVLILNDQFGALSIALENFLPFYWTDSFLSQQALQLNANANQVAAAHFFEPLLGQFNQNELSQPKLLDSRQQHSEEQKKPLLKFDYILIRIPKHNSLLKFQLSQLPAFCHQDTKIIAAGMTKEIHNSNIKLFERYIGPTKTSLAKKKARLILPSLEQKQQSHEEQSINDNLSPLLTRYTIDSPNIELLSLPGVFSRKSLDIGSQVLLNYLPKLNPGQKIIDLGCGNGLLAAALAKENPSCHFLLTDESRLAVESAKLTFRHNQLVNAEFLQTDVLMNVDTDDFDHVICNPPFHQQNVQTLAIAANMFKQSAKHLAPSGELRVVANRHLKYGPMLKNYFKQVESISNDAKFTVWLATQPIN